jgi:type I restriction enzyme M protein
MTVEIHSRLANVIWGICNFLRGPYKRNELFMIPLMQQADSNCFFRLTAAPNRVIVTLTIPPTPLVRTAHQGGSSFLGGAL